MLWSRGAGRGRLSTVPQLTLPTAAVQSSYLDGESDLADEEGLPATWIEDAAVDFDSFVARRREVRQAWEVPVTELWFVDGAVYIGTLVIRHRLTPTLARDGGHVGYHVVPRQRRRGHATQMLAQAKSICRDLGLVTLLITCDETNVASQRVIEANGGALERIAAGVCRYWVPTTAPGG
jgi:predicted acetyltransferase